jgi:hypothetical protein
MIGGLETSHLGLAQLQALEPLRKGRITAAF